MTPGLRQRAVDRLQAAWLERGPTAMALLPLAATFGMVAALRRALYRHALRATVQLPVPVVVVGNLVVGGAGKTPAVMAVVTALRRRGFNPGIVARGHGRRGGEAVVDVRPETPADRCGDEPLLLRLRTGAPVVVGSDRVAAGRELLLRHPGVDIIVADDGLQHLALGRSVEVLVFDDRGAGNGWLLPAGPLREPLPAVLPPRCIVLYNATSATTPLPGFVGRRRLAGVAPLERWWRGAPPSRPALEALRGRPITAAAGLARPQRFFDMLRGEGLDIAALPLPDHHRFDRLPWPAATADVVVTEKDAVKLDPAGFADAPGRGTARVWVAALDFEPETGFDAALCALLPDPSPAAGLPSNRHGSPLA